MEKLWTEVDFNSLTKDGKRVLINTEYFTDLVGKIYPNQEATFYTPGDVAIDGYVEMDKDMNGKEWWYGVLDWTTNRELPEQ